MTLNETRRMSPRTRCRCEARNFTAVKIQRGVTVNAELHAELRATTEKAKVDSMTSRDRKHLGDTRCDDVDAPIVVAYGNSTA